MSFMKLLGLCVSMFLGAYLCGEAPLRLSIPASKMKFVTTIGVGLLIGVSFIVIIPEGVHTYYGADKIKQQQHIVNQQRHDHATPMMTATTGINVAADRTITAVDTNEGDKMISINDESLHTHDENDHATSSSASSTAIGDSHGHDHAHGDGESHQSCVDLNRSSTAVGAALILGFVLMLIVDRIGGEGGGHSHGDDGKGEDDHSNARDHNQHEHRHSHDAAHANQSHHRSDVESLSPNDVDISHRHSSSPSISSSSSSSSASSSIHHHPSSPPSSSSPPTPVSFDQTATIGILVHSAIDGLALGAISVSDNSALEYVVFIAIILHKAPAAFGLASFLMHQGRPLAEVRKHLLYFALAAPCASVATYACFTYYETIFGSSTLTSTHEGKYQLQSMLGLCLLFSGGTFLYTIAAHILPEIQTKTNKRKDKSGGGTNQTGEWKMKAALVAGILAPLAFTGGHNHGH